MRTFDYATSRSAQEAVSGLSKQSRPLAGGTDLLPLMKLDIESPPRLVDIKPSGLPAGIEEYGQGVRLGALTTLSDIAANQMLADRYRLLVQAASEAATAQIRNRATLGGNLLQRPRCWYFRNPRTRCWLKGGEECLAVAGCNEQHAIFGDSPCKAVHPSDLAGCLLALDAAVSLRGGNGTRRLPLSDFFAQPEEGRRRETVIQDDELITSVDFPNLSRDWSTLYLKAMDRKAWAFALAGIAVAMRRSGGRIEALRIVANGVAPVPCRLESCERSLQGSDGGGKALEEALEALAREARPLSGNGYKLDLLQRLLCQAMEELARD